MLATTLDVLSEPMPSDDDLDEIHEWALVNDKGFKMLLRYLWPGASLQNKDRAKALIEEYIKIKFEKYYIAREGSFSYYPGAAHATSTAPAE